MIWGPKRVSLDQYPFWRGLWTCSWIRRELLGKLRQRARGIRAVGVRPFFSSWLGPRFGLTSSEPTISRIQFYSLLNDTTVKMYCRKRERLLELITPPEICDSHCLEEPLEINVQLWTWAGITSIAQEEAEGISEDPRPAWCPYCSFPKRNIRGKPH